MKKNYLYKLIFIIILSFATNLLSQNLSNRELVKEGKKATVLVKTKDKRYREVFATAFCIDKSGLFVTNYHVIEHGASNLQLIMHPGKRNQKVIPARLIREDKENDLALLQTTKKIAFSSLQLGEIKNLYETMEVMTFGFPFGKALAIKQGKYPVVSVNLGRISSLREGNNGINLIQLDVMLNPGNSGGPVIDKQGKVVGVVAFGVQGSGVNFSIPVNILRTFLKEPIFQFIPPKITQQNMHKPTRFTVKLVSFLKRRAPLSVELKLKAGNREQTSVFKNKGNIYETFVIPVKARKMNKVDVEIIYSQGEVKGNVTNHTIKVNNEVTKISDIEYITLKPQSAIKFSYGKEEKTPVISGLKSHFLDLGNDKFVVDFSKAKKIKFYSPKPVRQITYQIIVKEIDKTLLELPGNIWLHNSSLPAGLVLYYSFDDVDTNYEKATDQSDKKNNGKVYGAKWTQRGKVGGAYEFDGRDDYIDVGYNQVFNISKNITIAAWVNFSSFKEGRIISRTERGGYQLGYNDQEYRGKLAFLVHVAGKYRYAGVSRAQIQLGKWYHVAGSYDGNNIKFYLNGALRDIKSTSGTIRHSHATVLIGDEPRGMVPDSGSAANFSGKIDEVMIFKRTLSDSEVKKLYDVQE